MPPDLEKQANAETRGGIAPEDVRAALERVVSSDAFGKSERPARFLRHLVETALRGDAQILKESVLGTDVFDRPADWDPRLDPVVRQEASRLRKRLANYYSGAGSADEVQIELPVGSYVPLYQRKPAKAPAVPIDAPPAPPRSPWPILVATAAFLALAAGAWRIVATHHDAGTSIAVLPFTNLSSDPGDRYFSDGLTDQITDALARLKTLRVIARSSTVQFRGKNADIREIGRTLNVTNILEGSVERSGDRIRIIAHLERASDGALVWSNTYERKASDLFAVQSELAAGIAGGLKVAAASPVNAHVPDAEAYEFFLKGNYDLQHVTPESTAQAELDFQHAIDRDPAYGAAYAGLAKAKYDRSIARGSGPQTEAELTDIQRLLHRALERSPDLPQVHGMLALLAMQYDRDWPRAGRELEAAMAGPPSAQAETDYAFFLLFRGRVAEADRHFSRMAELDPYSTATQSNLALARSLEGRFQEARTISQKAAAENPRMLWTQQLIGLTYVEEGHPELALPLFQQLRQRWPAAAICEAMALAKSGRRQEALDLIRPYEQQPAGTGVAAEWLALVYAFMGDASGSMKWLNLAVDRHETQSLSVAVDPAFAFLRKSPEFQALVKRIGLDR